MRFFFGIFLESSLIFRSVIFKSLSSIFSLPSASLIYDVITSISSLVALRFYLNSLSISFFFSFIASTSVVTLWQSIYCLRISCSNSATVLCYFSSFITWVSFFSLSSSSRISVWYLLISVMKSL